MFLSATGDFYTFEEIIHSIGNVSGQHPTVLVYREFGVY